MCRRLLEDIWSESELGVKMPVMLCGARGKKEVTALGNHQHHKLADCHSSKDFSSSPLCGPDPSDPILLRRLGLGARP